METMNIEHRLITPYHPQANGKGESAVKIVKKALKHAVANCSGDFECDDGDQSEVMDRERGYFDWGTEWDQIPIIIASMRATMQPRTSTTYSPLYELTGRTPIVDSSQIPPEHKADDNFYDLKYTSVTKQSVQERIDKLQVLRAQCKVSLRRAQQSMKQKFDKKRGSIEFLKVGEKVLYRLSKSSRFNNRKANQIWLPRNGGHGVIKHMNNLGRCKVDIFNANDELTTKMTIRIKLFGKEADKKCSLNQVKMMIGINITIKCSVHLLLCDVKYIHMQIIVVYIIKYFKLSHK